MCWQVSDLKLLQYTGGIVLKYLYQDLLKGPRLIAEPIMELMKCQQNL